MIYRLWRRRQQSGLRRVEIAEQVYEVVCGFGSNDTLREKLLEVMYENEQLKVENFKFCEMLNKAYDFVR